MRCGCCKNLARSDEFYSKCDRGSLYQFDENHPIEYEIFWDSKKGLRHYSPKEVVVGKHYISLRSGCDRYQICQIRETDQFFGKKAMVDVFHPIFFSPAAERNLAQIAKCYVVFGKDGAKTVHCFEEDVAQAIHFAKQVYGVLQIFLY